MQSSWLERLDTAVLRRRLALTVAAAVVGALAGVGLGTLGLTVGVGMLAVGLTGLALVTLYIRSTTPSVSASIRETRGVREYLDPDFAASNPERLLFVGLGLLLAGVVGVGLSLW